MSQTRYSKYCLGVDAVFACHDPAGNGLEFYCGDTRDNVAFASPQGVEGFVTGEGGMGHAVFAAPDFEASHAFYRDVCGFHDTDLPHFKFSMRSILSMPVRFMEPKTRSGPL